jgi:hypothetical protein
MLVWHVFCGRAGADWLITLPRTRTAKSLVSFCARGYCQAHFFVTGLLLYFLSKLRAAKRIVKSRVKFTPVNSSSQVKTSYSVMPSGAANST